MSRSDTESDIIETLGQIPDFFKDMPDDTLAREWPEWKSFQLADSALTAREKHLIGLGVAAPPTARIAPTSTTTRRR